MAPWILLIIGIIIGWIIGVIISRQNDKNCRKHLDHLRKELLEQESAIDSSQKTLNRLEHGN